MNDQGGSQFYHTVPVLDDFADVVNSGRYVALPNDWMVGLSDIVSSTAAIAAGRYKTVNMVGASVISAAMNAFGHRNFPFVFGGDGASLAIGPNQQDALHDAMARVQSWALDETGLELRCSIIPVSEIQKAGYELRVAKFQAAPSVTYAMFSGGGLTWADKQLKAGAFSVPPAGSGSRPDLSGLSCRWTPINPVNGLILSILALPSQSGPEFTELVWDVLNILHELDRDGHPVPVNAHELVWPPATLDLEARATRGDKSRMRRKLELLAHSLFQWALDKTGKRIGRYDPWEYRRELSRNSDFRKYDDGLRLTVDCSPELADRIEQRLRQGLVDGVGHYGIHRQDSALVTCLVPSAVHDDHMHFIDGGDGGYTQAAKMLKEQAA